MSVVSIPILNKNYQMGCEDGQESRLIELGKMVDLRAREICDKIGPLSESSLLATLCIVLADEIKSRPTTADDSVLQDILERVRVIKKKINSGI
ncbi:MAG: cell division protein ZapA [Rickettsiales bacterium]|jgi:cell division protein ZapA|nr:cell division protein ZapA [Rickettsiales bacterium]